MKIRKISIMILCIASICLISFGIFIIFANDTNKDKDYKELKWNVYYGKNIPSEYEIYKHEEFNLYNFNLNTIEKNTSFDIKLPKNLSIEEFNYNNVIYMDGNVSFDITKTYVENIYKELEKVKETNEPLYEKTYIESTKYDDNIFAIIIENAKYNSDKTTMMFNQEVRIYIKSNDESEYTLIDVDLTEKRIDKEMLSNIINSIIIKDNSKLLCDNNKCEINLNKFHKTLDNEFSLKINKDKYVLDYNEGMSGTNAYFITKEYSKVATEETGINKFTRINLKLVYNNTTFIENLLYQEEIEIDGKKIICSYEENKLDDVTQYKGTYIYQTDNNILVIIEIDSRLDNVEEVLKDFIKFNI